MTASIIMSAAVIGTEAKAVAYDVDYEFRISGTVNGTLSYGGGYCGFNPQCSPYEPYTSNVSFLTKQSNFESVQRDGDLFTFNVGAPIGNSFYGSFLFDGGAGTITPLSLTFSYYAGTSSCNNGSSVCMIRASTSNFQVVQTRSPFGPVPEPATWAMMLAGFGAVGFATRRRRQSVSVSYA